MNGDVSIADCNQRAYDDGKVDKTGVPIIKPKAYFEKLGDWLDFGNTQGDGEGQLSFGTYSYEIDSFGDGELTQDETKQLFLSMMNYYKAKGDLFWESNATDEARSKTKGEL